MLSFLTASHRQDPEPNELADVCRIPKYPSDFPHDSEMRTEFLSARSKTVAYPSCGGIILGYFTAVELAHLGVSRTQPTKRSTDSAEEDDFALRMLGLGAHWWPSWKIYASHRAQMKDGIPYGFHFPPIINVGYPSSGKGLWIFKFSADETWDDQDGRPDDWDKIELALTMDERCELLKAFGGRFYEREDCPDIAKSIPDAMERGSHFVELLKKMDDVDYLDNWLNECSKLEEEKTIAG